MTGLVLYLFWARKPKTGLIWGISLLLFGLLIQVGSGFQFKLLQEASAEVQEAEAEGRTPSQLQVKMAEAWEESKPFFEPSEEVQQKEIEAYTGSYKQALEERAPETLMMQTQSFFFFLLWRVLGLMLLGMALMRSGVFTAERSNRFYIIMGVCGYVIGLPLAIASTTSMIAHNFDIPHRFMVGNPLNYVGSVLVALGHVSVVMLICKAGVLTRLRGALGAVGQMALTNYLMQSIICTTIFYGYGLGLFGRFDRFQLLGFVAAVWILQLLYSPWWLKRFRYGPAEWLWRSLTYWKRQPMRIAG